MNGKTHKQCPGCNRRLALKSFNFRKSGPRAGRPRARCKKCEAKATAKWTILNPALKKAWYALNPGYYQEYRRNNRGHLRELGIAYNEANKRQIRLMKRRYERIKRQTNLAFRLLQNLRSRVGCALKGGKKFAGTVKLLGCSLEFLRGHLESLFSPGMSWGNYGRGPGKWNLDHIRPCAVFDLTDPSQQRVCFHWTNLQPLWHEDNLRKSSKIPN